MLLLRYFTCFIYISIRLLQLDIGQSMRKLHLLSTLLLLTMLYGSTSFAQDFSNKGKEFYLCFPQHVPSSNVLATLSIWITSDKASTGTITMANGAFNATFNIPANGLQEIQIPHAIGHISNAESFAVIKKSIRVKVDPGKPAVVAYVQQWGQARSAASLLLPVTVLGKKYYSINFTQSGSNSGSYIAKSQFQIIAVKNNTVVKITPNQNGVTGTAITITLPLAGDMYQYQADQDLTGTLIESVASIGGGCLPIAVFSGSSNITFGTASCNGGSFDPLFQQGYPVSTWGKNFGFIPFADYPNGSSYRVLASEDNTSVFVNGAFVTMINAGQFYPSVFTANPVMTTLPTSISADKPICVAQYAPTQACGGGGFGDPDMVILNPIEQNISDITIFSSTQQNITRQWVNVLMKTIATPSFTINGLPPATAWQPVAAIPGYSFLRHLLPGSGSYRIKADSAFNAIAYGFSSNFESYAYSAGTNVKDLYQQIGVASEFGIEPTPSVCTGSPFKFKVSLPYLADSILWDFSNSGLPGSPANQTIHYSSPPQLTDPDSIRIVNGKNIYWYSLPSTYTFNIPGTYPITITTYSANTEGCGSEQDIDFDLEVSAPPVADFTWLPNQCIAETVQFNDASITTKPTYKFWWSFGDPGSGANNISTLKNPTHIFSTPGTYTIRYSNVTTPGCLSDTIQKTITIAPLPTATIAGTASVCINSTPQPIITFTATGGTAPYTFSYTFDNGTGPGPVQTINSAGTTVTIPVSTATAGAFTYTLVNIKNQNSTLCTQAVTGQSATVTVTANTVINLTSATPTTSQAVCVNTAITDITYAISGGGTGATVTGLPTGVTGVYNAGVVTISGTPTGAAQVYNYSVNATGACLPSSVTGSITINPDAIITLTSATSTTAQEVCKNTAIANITYTLGGGGTGIVGVGFPAGVTYALASGGIVTISGTPTVAGIFNYTLTTIGTCQQTQATGSITINELPTANFTVVAPNCENKIITFNDASIPNAGNLNNWAWNFGDATTGTGVSTTHAYALAGSYTVTLSVTTDKGCVSGTSASQTVNVTVNPKAGFIVPEVCINDIAAIFVDTSKIPAGNNITSWKWDFGDPGSGPLNTSTVKDGTHLYTATGSYTVTHIAFSSTGCSDTIQHSIFINGANPITDFSVSGPTTLCANDSVSITNLSVVNPGNVTKVEIYWNNVGAPTVFDTDDIPVLNKVYKHKYPTLQTTQIYTIRFRAYSGTLCVDDRVRNVTVNAAPRVQFNNVPDVCLEAPAFQVTQASEIGGVPGTASFSGPGITSGGLFTPSLAGPGTHSIKYTFTATAGGCIDTLTKTIHVYEPTVAAFSFTSPACETKDVTFSDNTLPTEGTLSTWTWNFGDGSPVDVRNNNTPFTHKFPAFGPYTVTLTVSTSNGCQSTPKVAIITVNPQPKVNFSIPPSVCLPNANVTFNDLSSIADGTEALFKYTWDFGDIGSGAANSSTNKNPSHTYTSTGPFTIKLQVETGVGCLHDTTILLNTIHPQPVAVFNTDKIDVCVGGSFNFTDNTDPLDGTTTQWNWTMDDGNVRNTPTFTYTYGAEGTYNVGLFIFNSYGCRSTTATTVMSVNPYPVANAGPDKIVLEGGQVMLTPAVPIGINVTYLWSPAATLNNAAVSNPLSSPKDDITYTLNVTSDKGCVARPDQVFVKVLKMPAIPNIFSPNGDGIHDRWGIEYLNTYPGATIDIYNRYGQLVFHSVGYATQWDGKANGKDVPVGTYYYVIDPKNGRQKIAGYVDVIR